MLLKDKIMKILEKIGKEPDQEKCFELIYQLQVLLKENKDFKEVFLRDIPESDLTKKVADLLRNEDYYNFIEKKEKEKC
jgi:hypothetical protein